MKGGPRSRAIRFRVLRFRAVQRNAMHTRQYTARRRLRSKSSADLVVPSTRRSTLGDPAFAVAGPRAWNSLSDI